MVKESVRRDEGPRRTGASVISYLGVPDLRVVWVSRGRKMKWKMTS